MLIFDLYSAIMYTSLMC